MSASTPTPMGNTSIPAQGMAAVTPADGTDLPQKPTRALMVTVAGAVAVVMADGSTGTLPALSAGVIYAVSVVRVLSTGTAATGIVALY